MIELWDLYDSNRNKTGRTIKRGEPMAQDEYHIVVHIWIKNSKGEWLISKRTPNKPYPNMWECTAGSAISGEDSINAAIREVNEELGIKLASDLGFLFKSYRRQNKRRPDFCDVWVFNNDCPISSIILQENETCDAMWASKEKIFEMMEEGLLFPKKIYPYIDELFNKY